MWKSLNRNCRRWHRWAAIAFAVPMLVVVVSGLLLQVKKQAPWVQPPTSAGSEPGSTPEVSWDRILLAAREEKRADVEDWDDIDRLDVRPSKGIVKIRCKSRWELQCDLATGEVLAVNFRRSDLIESFHDGSFFGDWAKLYLFLPNGLALALLWGTGIYLWWLPIGAKRKKRSK